MPHTHASHVASSQPGFRSRLSQQGPGVGVPSGIGVGRGVHVVHSAAQSPTVRAIETQVASHGPLQQASSTPHTQATHTLSSQEPPSCGTQQSPPGVGVGDGGTPQEQTASQSSLSACPTQTRSQPSSLPGAQQTTSPIVSQTQAAQSAISQLGPAWIEQQSPPGVGVGCAAATPTQVKEQNAMRLRALRNMANRTSIDRTPSASFAVAKKKGGSGPMAQPSS